MTTDISTSSVPCLFVSDLYMGPAPSSPFREHECATNALGANPGTSRRIIAGLGEVVWVIRGGESVVTICVNVTCDIYLRPFFAWHADAHRDAGIGFMTPAMAHFGYGAEIALHVIVPTGARATP